MTGEQEMKQNLSKYSRRLREETKSQEIRQEINIRDQILAIRQEL